MKTKSIYLVLILAMIIATQKSNAQAGVQQTIKNLQAAFLGESTASAKYAAYAKKAHAEGLDRIGLMFEATSKAESIHAGNHKAVLQQLGAYIMA